MTHVSHVTPQPQYLGEFHVVRMRYAQQPITWAVRNPGDAIQKVHMAGAFYEPEELEIIRRHFRPGQTFVDIGANVGNHAIFAAKIMLAAKVVVIEPNPVAIEILNANTVLNDAEAIIDRRWLGFGLGAEAAEGFGVRAGGMNLGGGKMVAGAGELRILAGDDVLYDTPVDFIKMDVEGMELDVLKGLSATIARDRPRLFIEVDQENTDAFLAWATAQNYVIANRFKRYIRNENFLLVPTGTTGD